jgi:CRISPR-associated protein (TIGR02584 family)
MHTDHAPADLHPRRVLLAVSGLSPQIVTETLYALAAVPPAPFVPTEIRLVTTAEGAKRARLLLLSDEPGWFHRLRADYDLPAIRFDDTCLHVIADRNGHALEDIRSAAENDAAADFITGIVRELTADDTCALHVSLAGGRKTMGFFLGYALSLYGRAQDRLSHVLVSSPFESDPQFFYPTRESRVLITRDNRPEDAHDAQVTLAEIPFVRLREGLPAPLLAGRARFTDVVAAAQSARGPVSLTLDLAARRIRAGGRTIDLAPALLAFYAWLARRKTDGQPPVPCPGMHETNVDHSRAFLAEYRALLGPMADDERTAKSFRHGMNKADFEQKVSKVNARLKQALGVAAAPYLIAREGRRPNTHYGLAVPAEAIRFAPIEHPTVAVRP